MYYMFKLCRKFERKNVPAAFFSHSLQVHRIILKKVKQRNKYEFWIRKENIYGGKSREIYLETGKPAKQGSPDDQFP